MLLKLICVIALTQSLVSAAPKKKVSEEHVAALFVKDTDNGELRFLTGTSNVNQLITQGQDFLEQLRPNSGSNNIQPIYINLNGGGIQTTSPTGTGGGGSGGGGNGGGGNGGVLGAVASNGSPVAGLLPQIVGQAVAGGGATNTSPTNTSPTSTSPTSTATAGNRRRIIRRVNKRRQGNRNTSKRRRNRRRPAKGNKQYPKVVVVRPQRG
nr:merozoite surface antigen 2 [Bactrocera oleae]